MKNKLKTVRVDSKVPLILILELLSFFSVRLILVFLIATKLIQYESSFNLNLILITAAYAFKLASEKPCSSIV